jgi:hypothetical protein
MIRLYPIKRYAHRLFHESNFECTVPYTGTPKKFVSPKSVWFVKSLAKEKVDDFLANGTLKGTVFLAIQMPL